MNIAEILNNDDGEKRTPDETSSNKDTSSRPGSPGKRPRNSPDIDGPVSPRRTSDLLEATILPSRAMSTPTPSPQVPSTANEPLQSHRKSKSISGGSTKPKEIKTIPIISADAVTGSSTLPVASASGSELEGSDRKGKSKRSKAKNSTWTIEDDGKLVDLVMSTLPTQDFAEYARILNKRDAQTVRYRWKVILRRAKGEGM